MEREDKELLDFIQENVKVGDILVIPEDNWHGTTLVEGSEQHVVDIDVGAREVNCGLYVYSFCVIKDMMPEWEEPEEGAEESLEELLESIGELSEVFDSSTYSAGVGPTAPPSNDRDLFEEISQGFEELETESAEVTGGSSPNYYRKPMVLPMADDRIIFRKVDLEAGDVIDAWDLNFNMGNIVKSSLRGNNKEGVDNKYALDKIIWFALREQYRQGIISHGEFWSKAVAVGLAKEK